MVFYGFSKIGAGIYRKQGVSGAKMGIDGEFE